MNEPLKTLIIGVVVSNPGIRGTELVVDATKQIHDISDNKLHPHPRWHDIPSAIEQLVEEGDLIEIEYVLRSMPYRVKSMYFPKGTQITLVNKG